MTIFDALQKAIKKAGGQTALAEQIGVSQPTIWFWLYKSKKGVAAEYCAPIEQFTGISKEKLRPDIYGKTNSRGN